MPIINGRYQTPSAFGYGVNDRQSIQNKLRQSISQRPPAALSRKAPPTETDRGETPSLLRNPDDNNLSSAAFGPGQNSASWQQVRNDHIDAARTGTPPPLFSPERRTTGTSDQMRVATDWANKGSSPGEIAQRMKTVSSMRNDDFGRRTPTVSPAAQAAEQQRKTAFNDWDSGRSGNPKGTPLTNQQLGIADNNDAVSAKVGFDVASSQNRTSEVLRQSQRAEELANKSRNTATRLNSERSSGLFS